ncbi:hypothetical protein WN944_012304 [Citrus x changshan-huyou]|uniref:Uncharacterized protein n=1 Tax=Citrus x changshan-huyou TaxID=2935761 RepID=A0AAP0QUG5_9ROSI
MHPSEEQQDILDHKDNLFTVYFPHDNLVIQRMMELFVLGCTGVVVFLHGANFFFHVLSQHLAVRSLR